MSELNKHSYHDLEVETAKIQKTLIFDVYGLEVRCSRVAGWELWDSTAKVSRLVAGEFDDKWLRLTVGDTVIVDSRTTSDGEYRYLRQGETIQEGDEWTSNDPFKYTFRSSVWKQTKNTGLPAPELKYRLYRRKVSDE